LEQIAQTEYQALNEPTNVRNVYLTQIMRYDVAKREEQALRLFGELLRNSTAWLAVCS
jgi:predicted solute-binding protein